MDRKNSFIDTPQEKKNKQNQSANNVRVKQSSSTPPREPQKTNSPQRPATSAPKKSTTNSSRGAVGVQGGERRQPQQSGTTGTAKRVDPRSQGNTGAQRSAPRSSGETRRVSPNSGRTTSSSQKGSSVRVPVEQGRARPSGTNGENRGTSTNRPTNAVRPGQQGVSTKSTGGRPANTSNVQGKSSPGARPAQNPQNSQQRPRPQQQSGKGENTERSSRMKKPGQNGAPLMQQEYIASQKSALSKKTQKQKERQEREEQKKKLPPKPKKSHKKGILVFLSLLILFGLMGFLGYKYIRAEEISVVGNVDIKSEYVIGLSGIMTGDHIFSVDFKKVENNLSADPFIKLKSLDYGFPNKLTINMLERKRSAAFEYNGAYAVIDGEGFILEVVTEMPQVPVVYGLGLTGNVVAGSQFTTDSTFKQDIMKNLLELINKMNISELVKTISLENENNIILTTAAGLEVHMGQSDSMEKKLMFMLSTIPELEKEGHKTGILDVSAEGKAAFRPIATPKPTQSNDIIYH